MVFQGALPASTADETVVSDGTASTRNDPLKDGEEVQCLVFSTSRHHVTSCLTTIACVSRMFWMQDCCSDRADCSGRRSPADLNC